MPYPTLTDDGSTVTLDLHGATIDEALDLSARAVRMAHRRGRGSIKLIHGTSTSESSSSQRTIKYALYDLLDEGALAAYVNSTWRADGHLLLSLDTIATFNPTRLTLRDLMR